MALNVNLDALIPRADFEADSTGEPVPEKSTIDIKDLGSEGFLYHSLRKPDFQRETVEWDPSRVVTLIRTFISEDLIPGVILWRCRDLVFVIDGSHRLGALIAWAWDDYGDGEISRKFFNYLIPAKQAEVAKRTRRMVEKEFGSYQSHIDALSSPENYGPDVHTRARRLGSATLKVQWVKGDAQKAEKSFIRINQQSAKITPQELQLIETRRRPGTIAARAIIRRGTGHKYWKDFGEAEKTEIEAIAAELHQLLFEPLLSYPIRSLDLPACGATHTATSLWTIYKFVGLCVGAPTQEDDKTGARTVEYLKRCRRVMRQLLSPDPSSLGLHPAVYFYSWVGKQQPILFLTITSMIIEFNRTGNLAEFTKGRKKLEAFLLSNRRLLAQAVRKFGTKQSGEKELLNIYRRLFVLLQEHPDIDVVAGELTNEFPYLQPQEVSRDTDAEGFSAQVKSGVVMRELLGGAPRCPICGGIVPSQAVSIDHRDRLQDGGTSHADNAQITHPYCNTGYKEMLEARTKKAKGITLEMGDI